jgi:hypothetical protein
VRSGASTQLSQIWRLIAKNARGGAQRRRRPNPNEALRRAMAAAYSTIQKTTITAQYMAC